MPLPSVIAALVAGGVFMGVGGLTLRGPLGVRWLRFVLASIAVTVTGLPVVAALGSSGAWLGPAMAVASGAMVAGFAAVSIELRTRRSARAMPVGIAVTVAAVLLLRPATAELMAFVAWSAATIHLASTFRAFARRRPGSLLDARLRTIAWSMALLSLGIAAAIELPAFEAVGAVSLTLGTLILWLAVAPPPFLQMSLSPTRDLARAVDRELARSGDPDRPLAQLLTRISDLFGAQAVVLHDGGRAAADAGPALDVAAAKAALASLDTLVQPHERPSVGGAASELDADGTGPDSGGPRFVVLPAHDRWVLVLPTGRGHVAIVLDEIGLLLGRDDRLRAAGLAERIGLVLDRAEAQRQDRHAAESLRAVDRMRDDFLATLSHELRTPLTSIRGFTEVLRDHDGRLPVEQRRDLQDRVVEKTAQLERMISGLLELTAVRGRSAPERVAAYDLRDLAERAVARARTELAEHTIIIDVPAALMQTDGGAVLAILGQLLDNAAKFTPAGSTVVVHGRASGDQVLLTVSDDGPGLGDLGHDGVFDAFVRGGDVLTRETRGVGIGLAIARELAGQLDGDLELAPSTIGTSIRLRVARHSEAVDDAGRRSALDAELADPDLHPSAAGPNHPSRVPHMGVRATMHDGVKVGGI